MSKLQLTDMENSFLSSCDLHSSRSSDESGYLSNSSSDTSIKSPENEATASFDDGISVTEKSPFKFMDDLKWVIDRLEKLVIKKDKINGQLELKMKEMEQNLQELQEENSEITEKLQSSNKIVNLKSIEIQKLQNEMIEIESHRAFITKTMQLVENEKNISNTNPNDLLNENKMLKDEIIRQKIKLKNEALQQELNADHMIDNLENSLKSNDNERKNFQLLVCNLTEAIFDARKDKYDYQDECDEKNQLLNAMTEEMNSLKINFAEKSSKMQKFIRHHKNRCDKDFENLLTITRKWKTKYFHLRNDLQQLQENGNVATHQLNDKVQYLENCVWNLSGQLQESDYNLNLLHQSSQDRENSLVTKLMDARIKFQNDKKLMQDNLNKVQQLFDSKEVAKAQNLYDSNLDMKAKISDLYESLSKVRLELQEATDKLQKERNENVKNVSNLNKSMMEFKNKPYWNEDDWYEFYSYQKNWLSQYHFEETEPENESCVITPAPHIVGKSHNHVTYGTLFATDLPNSNEDSKSEEDNSANQSDQDMIKKIKFLENKLNNSSLKQADRNRLRTQIKKLKESSPSYEEDFKRITNSNEYGRRSIYAPMFNPYTDAYYGFPVPTQGNRSYL